MATERLSLALAAADLMPEGRILVLRPAADSDLAALPQARCLLVQGFRPDHDALTRGGWSVVAETAETGFAAAVVLAPRSRAEARALVAEAAARVQPGGPIWLDGAKTDGIDSLLKDVRGRVELSAPFAKAHGKVAMLSNPGPAVFADWAAGATHPAPGFVALPGCFSATGIDAGSAALASVLPMDLKGKAADLGAGWGWLSAEILKRQKVTALHLVEAEWAALQSSRTNVADPRAEFHWADLRAGVKLPPLDLVVMNPPFHVGRAGDPSLGAAFIRAAAGLLVPSGQLYMVANRHLPYEEVLAQVFGEVEELKGPGTAGAGGFKLFRAARPLRRPADSGRGIQRSPKRRGR
jgi:16S rRNA (guanine1207-N2)-methyltransferase